RRSGRIMVARYVKGERLAWKCCTEMVDVTVVEVGLRARGAGAAALLYTDVSRDGTEAGPNVEYTATVARDVAMPVLASGGVGRVEDLARLAAIPGVVGTVVGRALYTGAIDLRRAKDVAGSGAGPSAAPRGWACWPSGWAPASAGRTAAAARACRSSICPARAAPSTPRR